MNISQMSLRRLRNAIHKNQVSFPSQVPVFDCQSRADIQWRLVELYFVRNWTCSDLAARYGVTMERTRQILTTWVRRAMVLGYLQEVPPLAALPVAAATMAAVAKSPAEAFDLPAALVAAAPAGVRLRAAAASSGA